MEQELGDSTSLDRTPSPPSYHDKWRRARQRKEVEFTSEAIREVAEKIDLLVEQLKVGLFVPKDCHHILVEAFGTEEYHRRVRSLRRGIGFKTYFG
ncbi:unnamed protein product [Lathyrus oleraceus]